MEVLKKFFEFFWYVYVSNSVMVLWYDEIIGNMICYGVVMYGLNLFGYVFLEVYLL